MQLIDKTLAFLGITPSKPSGSKNFGGEVSGNLAPPENYLSGTFGTSATDSKMSFGNGYPNLGLIDGIRNKVRTLSVNDTTVKRYVEIVAHEVVGKAGESLHWKTEGESEKFKRACEEIKMRWNDWCAAPTVDGQTDIIELQEVIVRCLALDGEVLLEKRSGQVPKIQMIDVSAIDTQSSFGAGDNYGMYKAWGFGLDRDLRRQTIFFREYGNQYLGNSGLGYQYGSVSRPRPAGAFIYELINLLPNQIRGIAPISSSVFGIEMLSKFDSGAIHTMLLAASTAIFLENQNATGTNQDDDDETAEEAESKRQLRIRPGSITSLAPGQKLASYAPAAPNFQHSTYREQILVKIAQGTGISNVGLTGDWSNTSYSSSKAASLQDRSLYGKLQRKNQKIMKGIFEFWLAGQVPAGLSRFEEDKLRNPIFASRAFPFIDAGKELTPLINGYLAGAVPMETIARKFGYSLEEWATMLQSQKELELSPYHNTNNNNAETPAAATDEDEAAAATE